MRKRYIAWRSRQRDLSFSVVGHIPSFFLALMCELHRRSRGPMIMNDAICVRDITRRLLATMAMCISGSRCVTRLIKIRHDLLRRVFTAWIQGEERETAKAGGSRINTRGREASVEREFARHTVAALRLTHVVSTQFTMKYRGNHRQYERTNDHNGLPTLS